MFRKADEMQIEAGSATVPFTFTSGTATLPPRSIQHAWFELTRARPFRSVALVPVDDNGSTLELAYELAQMASLDPHNRVLVVNATGMVGDPRSTGRAPVGDPTFGATGAVPAANGKYWILDCAKLGLDDTAVGMVEVPKHVEQMRSGNSPFSMIIVAATSLLTRPAGVSTARSVDTVVLCATLGYTSFADARRSVELVGEENIAGTIAIRHKG